MHHIHHFLDDLAGEILKVLRHHNFQQLGIGGLCLFGHLAQVLARVFGQVLEFCNGQLVGIQLFPAC
jgi:predicted esterase YcpF (UPF0227 family)